MIQSIHRYLLASKRVAIVIHQSPDGDALGSGIALAYWLRKEGHQVTLVSPDRPPKLFDWLPGIDFVRCFDQEGARRKATQLLGEAELIFCLDFPVEHRAGHIAPLIGQIKVPKIAIDHHPDHEDFADLMWIDTSASATSVLIYRMIEALGKCSLIERTIATALYVGIFTDTGSFQYTNTNAEAHLIAGKLVEKGADLSLIRDHMTPRDSLQKRRFTAHMFLNRFCVMLKYRAAYLWLPRRDYLAFDLHSGDTSGLASQALEIEGIDLAVLLVEREEKIHLSFRSREPIPVNYIAQKHFSGGGHPNAAGGYASSSLQKTSQKLRQVIIQEIPPYLDQDS